MKTANKKDTVIKTATATTTTATTSASYRKKECHTDPCEIIANLWIGSCWSVDDMTKNCSVIVPLSDSDGDIWNTWRGELLYVPITDYRALPIDVLSAFAMMVVEKLEKGETVGIHCMGGHGRTGYFVSAVLWLLEVPQLAGYPDPVKYIREKYCKKAIESHAQLKSLSDFTGIVGLENTYEESKTRVATGGLYGSYWKNRDLYGSDTQWDDWYKNVKDDDNRDKVEEKDPLFSHPCYDCLHAYEVQAEGRFILACELSNNMESTCLEYFPWSEYDALAEVNKKESNDVGECKGIKSVTIKN